MVQVFSFGLCFAVWVSALLLGRHFLHASSLSGKSSCWIGDLPFGCQSSCWEGIFIISLLSGATIPVGCLICCLGVCLAVGKTFS